MAQTTFDSAFARVKELVADFRANENFYLSLAYQEQEVRRDFIDKFWMALGWDVNHDTQKNPYEQEVKVERKEHSVSQRRADYAFYLAPNYRDVKFFVEAKKPHGDIATADNYFQTIRYGWGGNTKISVLNDFEQFEIVDCRFKANIDTALSRNIRKFHFSDYEDSEKFAQIYWLFSREAVANDSIGKFVATLPKKRAKDVEQGDIDEAFLAELDEQREHLAHAFKNQNPELDGECLTELTQRTLDRLVFLRFLEDKAIEPQRRIAHFGEKGTAWQDFIAESRRLDGIYNGIVYKEHRILDSPKFKIADKDFTEICKRFSHVNSPYDFNAIPIHILGSIYERFLGKVITTTDKRAKVEEKPEVRKAGGVYYTPDYIVRYIVENTVGKLIEGKTPTQISEMRFADIACGSGSFLLGVYDHLLRYHIKYYTENPGKAKIGKGKKADKADCVQREDGLHLTLEKKREILLNNIYGVDIDAQAVEVAQLSLYLKLLQDETPASARQYYLDFEQQALLPTLSKNIVCGNSLIGTDILNGHLFEPTEERKLNPMNFKDAFPEVMKRGGFDAIVGNPPYGFHQIHDEVVKPYFKKNYSSSEGSYEHYFLFYEATLRLLRSGGLHGFIVPVTWLTIPSAGGLRKFILNQFAIREIAWLPELVFKNAQVNTLVSIIQRGKPHNVEVLISSQNNPSLRNGQQRTFEQSEFIKSGNIIHIFESPVETNILSKLELGNPRMCDVAKPCSGYNPYEVGAGSDENGRLQTIHTVETKPYHSERKQGIEWKPEAIGRNLSRYFLQWPETRFIKYGPWLAAPRDPENFVGPRLLVQEIAGGASRRIIAGFCDKELYHSRDIIPIKCERAWPHPLFLLGIVNFMANNVATPSPQPQSQKGTLPKSSSCRPEEYSGAQDF